MSCCCGGNVAIAETESMVQKVVVTTGRLVDYVCFTYVNGFKENHGKPGGDNIGQFDLDFRRNEYIVKVNGRQGKHLDGLQFVTNLGRHSPWYGGGGGNAFQMTVPAGEMLIGFETDAADNFCPRITGLISVGVSVSTKRPSMTWLVINRNTRKLAFSGKPSLIRLSMKGTRQNPSVLKLILSDFSLLRLMFKGNPSFVREVLSGEERRNNPNSLFRLLSGDDSYTTIPGKSAMQVMLHQYKDRTTPSLTQMLLRGKPSPARQFFGKPHGNLEPLASMLFYRDPVNGFPSIFQLILEKETNENATTKVSLIESLLYGEAIDDGPKYSLMRLLLIGKPSMFDMLLDGEKEGKGSMMRFMVHDENGDGLTFARKVLTSFHNHKGYRPALCRYVVEGELQGKSSMLRRLLAGQTREDQSSLLHLLLYRYSYIKKQKKRLLRMGSSFRSARNLMRKSRDKDKDKEKDRAKTIKEANSVLKVKENPESAKEHVSIMIEAENDRSDGSDYDIDYDDDEDDSEEEADMESEAENMKTAIKANFMDDVEVESEGVFRKRSLMQLMLMGKPSIFDLILDGELEGDDSLARLFLATSAKFENGRLKLGGTLDAKNKGVSLMQLMLAGEEDGGPGISFMRLLLMGEEDNGFSLLRLLLINESTSEPSIFRIMLTALKGILTASRIENKTDITRWKSNFKAIAKTVLSSQKKKKPVNFQDTVSKVMDIFSSGVGNFNELFKILRTIPQKGKEFEGMWRSVLYRVAKELRNSGKRITSSSSLWPGIAPKLADIAEDIGNQKWTRVVTKSTSISVDLGKLINKYRKDLKLS